MKSPTGRQTDRSGQIEYVSTQLLARAAALTRLLAKQVDSELSQTEAKVLSTLRDGPRRITDLAELEGLAQPTTTLLVKRLEELGLVRRERQADDGRVVLVSLEPAGARSARGLPRSADGPPARRLGHHHRRADRSAGSGDRDTRITHQPPAATTSKRADQDRSAAVR